MSISGATSYIIYLEMVPNDEFQICFSSTTEIEHTYYYGDEVALTGVEYMCLGEEYSQGVIVAPFFYYAMSNVYQMRGNAYPNVTMHILPVYPNTMSPKCMLVNNTASGKGGGLFAGTGNDGLVITNSYLDSNTASFGGGGYLNNFNVNASILNSQIRNNLASSDGGGVSLIYANNGALFFNCSLLDNHGARYGGGVHFNMAASDTLVSGTFENNLAGSGGAIYFSTENTVIISNSSFANNKVLGNGGALCLDQSNNVTLNSCVFQTNEALQSGGAVASTYVNIVTINWSSFYSNWAGSIGGAIVTQSGITSDIVFKGAC